MNTIAAQPNQGLNVTLGRKLRKISQAELADRINMHQTEISAIENQRVIEQATLKKISKALELPVEFFTDFDLGEAANTYHIHDNTNSNESTDIADSNNFDNIIGQKCESIGTENIYNTYGSLDKVTELYERLLDKEKEEKELLRQQIAKLEADKKGK